MLNINATIAIPDDEFQWSYARAGGPGGQNVNKVSSKAVLRWNVAGTPSLPDHVKARLISLNQKRMTTTGDLLITGQRFRDQERNRQDCLDKLAEVIREAATLPKTRRATKPTKGSHRRRLASKKRRSSIKEGRRDPDDDA
jgi:ribosome-associated protein